MKLSEVILQTHRYTTTLPKLLSNSDENKKVSYITHLSDGPLVKSR